MHLPVCCQCRQRSLISPCPSFPGHAERVFGTAVSRAVRAGGLTQIVRFGRLRRHDAMGGTRAPAHTAGLSRLEAGAESGTSLPARSLRISRRRSWYTAPAPRPAVDPLSLVPGTRVQRPCSFGLTSGTSWQYGAGRCAWQRAIGRAGGAVPAAGGGPSAGCNGCRVDAQRPAVAVRGRAWHARD